MSEMTTRVAIDTYVKSTSPSANYQQASRLGVKGSEQYAYVYFSRPFPPGASIVNATLKLQTYAMGTGTHTITVNRTGERTFLSKVNWNNKPVVYTLNAATATKTGSLPGGTEWEFDISGMMQQVADGAQWFGVRVAIGENNQRWIYASETERGPVLEVEWSDAPDAPENLVPSEGLAVGTRKPTLRFDYVDVSGNQELKAAQVQINATNSWASPAFDSGEVEVSEPELNLSTTAYAGLPTNGSQVWWRVRVKDGAGLWSEWSDAERMRYVARPTVTVTSPTGQFYDTTPVVSWSLDAGTQSAYQVLITPSSNPSWTLWNSGKVTSSDTSLTIPKGFVRWDDRDYRFYIRVWDSTKRVSTPGSPAYGQTVVNSLYDKDAAVPGVSDVTAVQDGPRPFVTLSWTYAHSLPDEWVISRNGEVVDRLDSDEVPVVGGRYQWAADRYAIPHTENTYVVRPVVNKRTAYGNASAKVTPKPYGIWLLSDESSICLAGTDTGSFEMVEHVTEHQVLGASAPAIVHQGIGGYTGEITGQLVSGFPNADPVYTAQAQRDRLLRFKERAAAGETFRLVVSDMNIPVKLYNVLASPRPEEEIMFDASFSFSQDGELPYRGL